MAQQRQQQQQLASLIQQQLQQQQLSAASPSNQLPARSNGTSVGHNSVPHPGGVSAGHGLMSPGSLVPHPPGSSALTNHGQSQASHVVSSAAAAHYVHTGSLNAVAAAPVNQHSPGVSHTANHLHTASSSHSNNTPHTVGPLYVQVTSNENGGGTGAQSPGAESAGTPLCSPELNLPDDSMHKTDTEKDTSQEDLR